MSENIALDRAEELLIALDMEMTRLAESVSAIEQKAQAKAAELMTELAAKIGTAQHDEIVRQCASIRVELAAVAEKHKATVLAERQRVIGLDELRHTLGLFAKRAAHEEIHEYTAKAALVAPEELAQRVQELAFVAAGALPELVKKEFAAQPPPESAKINLADVFQGPFDEKKTYKRGQMFSYHGGTYLVLRESRGIVPTYQEMEGSGARYALIASPGASAAYVPPFEPSSLVVSAPATATSPGTPGTFAYSGGYLYFWYKANKCVRVLSTTF